MIFNINYSLYTYKTISTYSDLSIRQISPSVLIEFIYTCDDLVDEEYNVNGVLLQERVVKVLDKEERNKTKNKNLPDNIIRHQFLNLLVKIAHDKYITRCKFFNL